MSSKFHSPQVAFSLEAAFSPEAALSPSPAPDLGALPEWRLQDLYEGMDSASFAADLERSGKQQEYMGLLVNHFNPATVDALMCRDLVSIGWDGRLYDCDFNQMLEIPLGANRASTIWDIDDVGELAGARIATASHCFGCTAGAGSSCGGAIA